MSLLEGLDRAHGYRVLAAKQRDELAALGCGRDGSAYPRHHRLRSGDIWSNLRGGVYAYQGDVPFQLVVVVFKVSGRPYDGVWSFACAAFEGRCAVIRDRNYEDASRFRVVFLGRSVQEGGPLQGDFPQPLVTSVRHVRDDAG